MPAVLNADATFEGGTWANVQGSWRRLHGSYNETGFSIEWHDFKLSKTLSWSESFHPDSLEICLNLAGTAHLHVPAKEVQLTTRSVAIYSRHDQLKATRHRSGTHRFLTVELSREYLAGKVGDTAGALRPSVRNFLSKGELAEAVLEELPMTAAEQTAFASWPAPAVPAPAQTLWYEAKVLELLARMMFEPPKESEMFCARQQRLGRERMERVMEILKARLHEPPSLEELGREVGCSPFYLSRTFSGFAGQTIPQYIRQRRMERAAELLREGRKNVTEVAFEVGYSSLGHFSKSFCEVIGVCPSLYPAASALVRTPAAIRR